MEKILRLVFVLFIIHQPIFAKFRILSYYEIRNKDVVRQNYEESCGASSVATLLNLINLKKYSELDIIKTIDNKNLNTNMLSFLELRNAIKKLGFEAKGYKFSRDIFEKLNIPVIVKIENDPRYPHFVVAINFKGDFISILDPNFGKYTSTKKEFYSIWDKHKQGGYVLIIQPNISFDYKLELPNVKFR